MNPVRVALEFQGTSGDRFLSADVAGSTALVALQRRMEALVCGNQLAHYERERSEAPSSLEPQLVVVDARAVLSPVALRRLLGLAAELHGAFVLTMESKGTEIVCAVRHSVASPRSRIGMPMSELVADAYRQVSVASLDCDSTSYFLDSYWSLARLEREVLEQRARTAMESGVRLRDPSTTYIRGDVVFGAGVEIDVNVVIEGQVALGDRVVVGSHCILRDTRIGAGTRINPYSLVEGSTVGESSFVGPYGRVRPGCTVGNYVQIGNFVELKNSRIGDRSRINHHSFIGDAVLEDNVTVGAGTITCNHDGVGTNQTHIERNAYIGSGCRLVAPVRVGADAVVGAGSTITEDAPANALTLARVRQKVIPGWPGPKRTRIAK